MIAIFSAFPNVRRPQCLQTPAGRAQIRSLPYADPHMAAPQAARRYAHTATAE